MKVFPEMIDMVSEERIKHSELEKLSYKQLKQRADKLGLSLDSIETKYKNKEATCKIKCTSKHNSQKRAEIVSLIYKQMYNPIVKRQSKRKSRKTKTTSYDPVSPPESPSLRDPPPLPRSRRTRRSSLRAQKKKKKKKKKQSKRRRRK